MIASAAVFDWPMYSSDRAACATSFCASRITWSLNLSPSPHHGIHAVLQTCQVCVRCPEDWSEGGQWLAAGLHARNRWRLPVLLAGMLFAHGWRTVTTWLRAAGVSADYQDHYYFLPAVGRKTKSVAGQLPLLVPRTLPPPDRALAVIDDTPTKR